MRKIFLLLMLLGLLATTLPAGMLDNAIGVVQFGDTQAEREDGVVMMLSWAIIGLMAIGTVMYIVAIFKKD